MHAPQVYPYIKNKVAFDSLALVRAQGQLLIQATKVSISMLLWLGFVCWLYRRYVDMKHIFTHNSRN